MSIITFPSALYISSMTWGRKGNEITYRSPFGVQSVQASTPLWKVGIALDKVSEASMGPYKALIMKLRGAQNQLALYDVARPEPRGTMRGTLTLNAAATAGDVALEITGGAGQASTTLKAGDMLGIGTATTQQVVMVVDDATADVSGVITVNVEPPLRDAFNSAESIEWDKPKALFRLDGDEPSWSYNTTFAGGFALDLIEDVRV